MQRALVQIPFPPHKESKQPLQRKPSLWHQGGHRGGLAGGCHLPCEAQPQSVPLSCSLCHPVHGFWSLGGAQSREGAGVALLAQGFAGQATDTSRTGPCGAATAPAELWGSKARFPTPAAGGFWDLSDALATAEGPSSPWDPPTPLSDGTEMSGYEWLGCIWLDN